MGKKKSSSNSTGETVTRTRKKAEKMPEGTFAAKLRVGPVTEAHMAGLAVVSGLKPRKVTRNVLKAYLTTKCSEALAALLSAKPAEQVMVMDGVIDNGEDLLG